MKILRVYADAVWLTIIFAVLVGFASALGRSKPADIVAFNSAHENDIDIYIADVTLGLRRNVTRDPNIRSGNPTWSPDGRQILFMMIQDLRARINILDIMTGKGQILFNDEVQGNRYAWSPDGQWIVYINRGTDYDKSGLYILNRVTGDVRFLTDEFMLQTNLLWSPDSRQIAFISNNQTDNFPIYLVDIETSKIRNFYTNPDNLNISPDDMAWSPDGRQMVYTLYDRGNFYLYFVDLESGLISRINHDGFDAADEAPAWSPDGRQIAFESYRDGSWGIYLMDVATHETRLLYLTQRARTNPVWSPTGRMLGFSDALSDVYLLDVETGKSLRYGIVLMTNRLWRGRPLGDRLFSGLPLR